MLHTTFTKLKENEACTEGYKKLAKSLGGVNKYGKNTPIPLVKIMDSNGLEDTIWCLRATIEPAQDLTIEFVCRCAEYVLKNYEDLYPTDKRPRLAIEAARRCITDKSAAAGSAAYAAYSAYSAAYSAADSAAYSAADAAADAAYSAYSAAREWQSRQLREILEVI
jgi:hypothetical protein